MKIKIPIDLLIIDILGVLLILNIFFLPNIIVIIILGLPFLLFFPGYIMLAILSPKDTIAVIDRSALSLGISIVMTTLIGVGLHYTQWGIQIESGLYSIATFVILISGVAILRRRYYGHKALTQVIDINIRKLFQKSPVKITLNLVMIVIVLIAIVSSVYLIAKPNTGDKFSEFYILGINGQAADYPTDFILNSNSEVVSVKYGEGTSFISEAWGRVILGIVNHEQQNTTYTIKIQIDGSQASIPFQNKIVTNIGPLILEPGEKWEEKIGIVPEHIGQNQEVELLLYKNNDTSVYLDLHLWVNVTQ